MSQQTSLDLNGATEKLVPINRLSPEHRRQLMDARALLITAPESTYLNKETETSYRCISCRVSSSFPPPAEG